MKETLLTKKNLGACSTAPNWEKVITLNFNDVKTI